LGDLYSDWAGSSQTPLPRGGHPHHDVILSGVSRALPSALLFWAARDAVERIRIFLRFEQNQERAFPTQYAGTQKLCLPRMGSRMTAPGA